MSEEPAPFIFGTEHGEIQGQMHLGDDLARRFCPGCERPWVEYGEWPPRCPYCGWKQPSK